MRKLMWAVFAATLWCSSVWASTTVLGPGGGGAFPCVSVNPNALNANVIIGSDNSGIYSRGDTSSTWTRRGSNNGLWTTLLYSISIDPYNPAYVIAGTGDGMYRSTDSGTSWSVPTLKDSNDTSVGWGGSDITAVGWYYRDAVAASDSQVCFAAWVDKRATDRISIAVSTDRGATFKLLTSPGIAVTSADRVPIKVLEEPTNPGSSRRLYLLLGNDPTSGAVVKREIWRQPPGVGGNLFHKITDGACNETTAWPVDIAFWPDLDRLAVTSSNSSSAIRDGALWEYSCSAGAWRYNANPVPVAQMSGVARTPTGAVWTDGIYVYVLNVGEDTGSGCTISRDAGLWYKTIDTSPADSSKTLLRVDDGASWELGWSDCTHARGRAPGGNVARSLSRLTSDKSQLYFIGSQFVYRYKEGLIYKPAAQGSTTGPKAGKFVAVHTTGTYNTTKLDNANPVTIKFDGSGNMWVGYYDIGLWKYGGSSWSNKNDTDWGVDPIGCTGSCDDWNGKGGNVSSILFVGSNDIYVTAAPSSKSNRWKIYKSTDAGSSFSPYNGDLPFTNYANGGSTGDGGTFMRSLARSGNGRLYVAVRDSTSMGTLRGRIFYTPSTGDLTDWSQLSFRDGMLTVAANGSTVLAGGWYGLYRSSDDGTSWSKVSSVPDAYLPTGNESTENFGSHLHRQLWNGVQQIVHDPWLGYWYVVLFQREGLTGTGRGVWRSTDDGVTFSLMGGTNGPTDKNLRRGVAIDSCGDRLHITSGRGFSSVVEGAQYTGPLDAEGLEICRLSGSTLHCKSSILSDAEWGFNQAHGIVSDDGNIVYTLAPGYGVHKVTVDGGGCLALREGDDEQFALGGLTATLSVQYAAGAFNLSAPGRVQVFDLLGRQVANLRAERAGELPWTGKPGMYFARFRSGEREASVRFVLLR